MNGVTTENIEQIASGERSRPRTCVVCLRADRPMTREHVFAHWLVLRLRGGRLVPSRPSSTAPTRIGRVIANVCAECNAGWMSGLEVSFRSAVFARPRVGAIHPQDRVILSRWFTKTAALLAEASGGALIGAAHRAQLVRGMPDDVEVFVARRRRPRQHLDFLLDTITEPSAGAMQVRSVAILVDDVVGTVAARGTLTSRNGTRLWPLRSHTLRWETLPVVTSFIAQDG